MKRIKHVSLDDISPGTILALDVTDQAGNVLTRKDTPLTEEHVTKLRSKKIARVSVFIEDDVSPEQEYARVIRMIDHQFRKMNNDPDMQKLKSIIVEYMTRESPHRHKD